MLTSPLEPPNYPGTYWALVERAVRERPDHVVLADDHGRSLTVSALAVAAEGFAATLHERGVGKGTVVSWQLPSVLETMVVLCALARLGAAQNPIVPIMREREVRFITRQVGTELFLVPETWGGFGFGELARTVAAESGFDVMILDLDSDPATTGADKKEVALRLELGDVATLPPPPPVDPTAARWLYHTSGTTAEPKGIRHSDATLMAGSTGMIAVLGVRDDDVNPGAFPVSHIGGAISLGASLVTGMRLVLFDTFDPATFGQRVAAHDPTILGSAVPFFLVLLDAQRRHGPEPLFPRLRICSAGGAPMPPEVCREVREVLGVPGVASSWGLTEFPVPTFASPDAPPDVLDTTVGTVVPGVSLRVVGFDGQEVARGEEGELRLKGPQRMLGYIDERLDVDIFDEDGWLCSGDLGVVDEQGNIRVTGRLKDIIIRNAENISALEVEDALFQHAGVHDVAVIGVPDARTGERVCAVVVPEAGAEPTLEALAAHCRALGLAAQKWPERVELVDDLPRTPMGKVRKEDLRKQYSTT
jgi:acyl-CoA synthetase (AMP-forming)/AMP-acid ligase II